MLLVNNAFAFTPERRTGMIFLAGLGLLLVAAGAYGVLQASQADIGLSFLLGLAPALLAVVLVPWLAYQAYALRGSWYIVEREGFRLRWGLRYEDIPMDKVLWVRPASELEKALPLPWMRLPGSLAGQRQLAEGGLVEFLASNASNLVIIATSERLYAISPANSEEFLRAYQRQTELGSLSPLPARSVYPSFLLARVWAAKPARLLLLSGAVLSLVLLALASLAVPGREQIALGFDPGGAPRDAIPAVRLLLLPVLNAFFFLMDLLIGMFFFRREESQPLAYMLWGGGVATPLMFLIGLLFILQSG